MELVVSLVHSGHRLMFELLAATGVRRSELLALDVRHLTLGGESPQVKIRQRVRRQRGSGLVVGPLKSRHARRDLPLGLPLAGRLAAHVASRDESELVFCSTVGTILDPDNVADRVLSPACAAAGVEWAGFHTFRQRSCAQTRSSDRSDRRARNWAKAVTRPSPVRRIHSWQRERPPARRATAPRGRIQPREPPTATRQFVAMRVPGLWRLAGQKASVS